MKGYYNWAELIPKTVDKLLEFSFHKIFQDEWSYSFYYIVLDHVSIFRQKIKKKFIFLLLPDFLIKNKLDSILLPFSCRHLIQYLQRKIQLLFSHCRLISSRTSWNLRKTTPNTTDGIRVRPKSKLQRRKGWK